jgi:hypothetical protein
MFSIPGTKISVEYSGAHRGGELVALEAKEGEDGRAELTLASEVELAWCIYRTGGPALIATHPIGQPGDGRLYRLASGPDLKMLLATTVPQASWTALGRALINDEQGRLYVFRPATDELDEVALDRIPDWARAVKRESEGLLTLRVERWPRSAQNRKSQDALLGKCAPDLGGDLARLLSAAVDRESQGIVHAGAFETLDQALAAARVLESRGIKVTPARVAVKSMRGLFDYGRVDHQSGRSAYLRRVDQSTEASEIVVVERGQSPRRLLPAWVIT